MDIFGIGGLELVVILIIMVIVAGPKRMIQWSYILGRELGKVRKMWGETAKMLQKEFDAAGVDIKVPEQPPTRGTLRNEAARMLAPFTKPMQDAMNEVNKDLGEIKQTAAMIPGAKVSETPKPAVPKMNPTLKKPAAASVPANGNGNGAYGTWGMSTPDSGASDDTSASGDFGAWGGKTE